ncbi:MAG: hypothetical protein KDA83_17245, partial [Planctomycetales bacterium]|nr:hypothetical protein [Planctomycetales bacterium]
MPGTIEAVTSDFAVATGGISYRTDGTPHVQSVPIDVAEAPSKPSMSECETERAVDLSPTDAIRAQARGDLRV